MYKQMIRAALSAVLVASAGCAATRPYLYNETNLALRYANSDSHAFTYIHVFKDGDETVLYGKVEHRHERGAEETHVDLAITNGEGAPSRLESMPLRSTSPKQHGWAGAAFRTRFKSDSASGARIFLAFHENE